MEWKRQASYRVELRSQMTEIRNRVGTNGLRYFFQIAVVGITHAEPSTVHFVPVQMPNRCQCRACFVKFDECKALGTTCVLVHEDTNFLDRP